MVDFDQMEKEKYRVLLTEEEVFKFQMYRQPPTPFTREEVEKIFWDVEDFKLCNGGLNLLESVYMIMKLLI